MVGFKFHPEATKKELLDNADSLIRRSRVDLVVANTTKKSNYCAYFLSPSLEYGPVHTKEGMAKELTTLLGACI